MTKYSKIIWLVGVVLVLTLGAWSYYESKITRLTIEINDLDDKLVKVRGSLAVEEANNMMLRSTISDMNKETAELEDTYKQIAAKYANLKDKPDNARYEVVYKYLTKESSNECEDIKNAVNGLVDYVNDRVQ